MTATPTARQRADMLPEQLLTQAHDFLVHRHDELGMPGLARRWHEVRAQVLTCGTWKPTYDELAYGARVAWRNAGPCIGRRRWPGLIVRDRRHITNLHQVRRELAAHLDEATNGGRIRSVITVLAPSTRTSPPPVRIISPQLARYAAWPSSDGVLGDPANMTLTRLATELGWPGPARRGPFDMLPWIAATADGELHLLPTEPARILEVPIQHPDHPWIAKLGLRWPAVPAVSNMTLDIGGLRFPAPFSGTFMASEIATRNLADEHRYDQLPAVIAGLGLDHQDRLRADKALLTLHEAVLHSFERAGVSITDHHRESRSFSRFVQQEESVGRAVAGTWSWLNSYPMTPQDPSWNRYYSTSEPTPALAPDPYCLAHIAGHPTPGHNPSPRQHADVPPAAAATPNQTREDTCPHAHPHVPTGA
ncbi:nitric oxide synthase oxygenase [Micromonospora sp. NPDC048999]|uniref:nitric oxide synthase oxygenase n=1 Tax=Micromonospora sp. NPDC048999 TaxID=3155391 RepID=UPI0033D92AFD